MLRHRYSVVCTPRSRNTCSQVNTDLLQKCLTAALCKRQRSHDVFQVKLSCANKAPSLARLGFREGVLCWTDRHTLGMLGSGWVADAPEHVLGLTGSQAECQLQECQQGDAQRRLVHSAPLCLGQTLAIVTPSDWPQRPNQVPLSEDQHTS